jgi:dihydroneopterin aldolase
MLGTINLIDLKIPVMIGVLPEERQQKQILHLDISMDCEFGAAVRSDDVQHTVDYKAMAESLKGWCSGKELHLLETLAEGLSQHILKQWPMVEKCRLHIKKKGAVPGMEYASVKISRKRKS